MMNTPLIDPLSDEFWDEFGNADPEQQVQRFLQMLDAGQMDNELAFEMLEILQHSLSEDAEGHVRYAELVWQLREKAPEAYRQEALYLHQTLLTFAIEDGRWDDVPKVLEHYRRETDLDIYMLVVDEAAYHGLERDIVPVMQEAFPLIKEQEGLMEWGIVEFGGYIMRLMLWIYLDTAASPSPDDADFLAATAPYGQLTEGWLEKFMPRFTAASPSAWKPDDFAPTLDKDTYPENLLLMMAECVADSHREGIPYERAYIATIEIAKALLEQAQSVRKRAKRRAKGKKGKTKGSLISAMLIPTYSTLNKTLADLVPFIGGRPYHLVAALELLPRYLQFLLRLGLVSEAEVDHALRQLSPLPPAVLGVLEYYSVDRRAVNNMLAAWEDIPSDKARR